LKLAQQGWRVAIIGRRSAGPPGDHPPRWFNASRITPTIVRCKHAATVQAMGQQVLLEFKEIELLVNAAGTNAPRRLLEVLSLEDYHAMIATNLNGAYYCVQAFLPQMRARRSGTIINIISDAGKQASPKAGPAYAMSKFGLAGLTQSINAEETRERHPRLRHLSGRHWTRRCSISARTRRMPPPAPG
jgi:NAD(P)-dependent dehydrogenase (short-subunit alcohol dehydrogenase family)